MLYAIFSHGRSLGTTDLGFIYRPGGFRTGWLHPTPVGERYLPIAAGVAPAMRTEFQLGPDPTLHADVLAACRHADGLELELRREDGVVIDTTRVAIIDTEYLLSIGDAADHDSDACELSPELQAEVDEMLAEFEQRDLVASAHRQEATELPRYQVQIQLVNPADVP